jgi:hypothetical protein
MAALAAHESEHQLGMFEFTQNRSLVVSVPESTGGTEES